MTKFMTGRDSFNDTIQEIADEDPFTDVVEVDGATLRDANHWDYGGAKLIEHRLFELTKK